MSPTDSNSDLSHLDYLVDVDNPKAMAFSAQNSQIATERLTTDGRYESTHKEILSILSNDKKLPHFSVLDNDIYNFWQDKVHVKGILRKSSIEKFNKNTPNWTTVLDMDLLSETENANWTYKGMACLPTNHEYCLIYLSNGGKDASVIREFNLKTLKFVSEGFYVTESKSYATWIDQNNILISDTTDPKTLTASGYATQIKLLTRGQNLKEAPVIFEGSKDIMGVFVNSEHINKKINLFIEKNITFSVTEVYEFDFSTRKIQSLPIPKSAEFIGQHADQIIFSNREQFQNFPAGSVLSIEKKNLSSDSQKINAIFTPTQNEFYHYAVSTDKYLWIGTLKDVKTNIAKYYFKNTWIKSDDIQFENKSGGNAGIETTGNNSGHVYFNYTDFLTPKSIYYVNENTVTPPKKVLSAPSFFDASQFKTTQLKVPSKDGTLIPYFVVSKRSEDLKHFLKSKPTLMYAYGGFEHSITQSYLDVLGKEWLEKGGIYVLANIRGGSEYGPLWHSEVKQKNRHKVYEDFYAIAEDLIKRNITTSAQLGIQGGSNGGLLTAVAMTQRPDLFKAVISEVPLTNMLQYHKWFAGAAWMDEYGNPDEPEMQKYLQSYSPLHNILKEKKYPEALFVTNTKDDRVHPAHARQMVAHLLELGHPVLYSENTEGGHGRAADIVASAKLRALQLIYLYQKLF